jgi:ketosteroid isomerase-like protein
MPDSDNLHLARRYLEAIERGGSDDSLAFFAPDVVQEEFPNRLTRRGYGGTLPPCGRRANAAARG